MARRMALPAMGIALANLAALALLVGWVGASRAFSVGIHSLIEDHTAALVASMSATLVLGAALGGGLRVRREILLVVAFALAADVLVALGITFVVDEMRNTAALAIPRALFTETVGGLQLLAVGGGAATGYLRATSGRQPRRLT